MIDPARRGVRLRPLRGQELRDRFGGALLGRAEGALGGTASDDVVVTRFVSVEEAEAGDLTVLSARRFVDAAATARARGACVLTAAPLAALLQLRAVRSPWAGPLWVHEAAPWAMAQVLLAAAEAPEDPPLVADDAVLGPGVVLGPRVVVGRRVRIGAGSVLGAPGFGWALGQDGARVAVPQLGGVVIEDDVSIGALCTIDAGTLAPTRLRRGAKLDAQVHVGHNCDLGEDTVVAAQTGFAGSVVVGRGVLVGGQVGVADHVHVGDGARLAAKSGVISDVPAGATWGGYPARPRLRWLRALAWLDRAAEGRAGHRSGRSGGP